MARKTLKEFSKTSWYTSGDPYPGDENIKLGCLQRIACSLEKMEEPYTRLLEDIEYLRTSGRVKNERIAKLEKTVAAYKGIVRRMKKARS